VGFCPCGYLKPLFKVCTELSPLAITTMANGGVLKNINVDFALQQ
jgi:hypothetical protein